MALKSTIFKAALQVADIDHGYYADHALTLARHPSETSERMMIRITALALNAHLLVDLCGGDGRIGFGAGLSDPDDPDVWLDDFGGRRRLWIEVGQPDDKALTRARSRTDRIAVYAYSQAAPIWWSGLESRLRRFDALEVWTIDPDASVALASLADRSMQLQATILDSQLTLHSERGSVTFEPTRMM
jgi:uncharacterized protein YaeQ